MWWSRALLLLVVLAGLAGCGFTPLYGRRDAAQEAAVAERMAEIRVLGIPDRLGQQMRNALVERLTPAGEPSQPRYRLDVKLAENVAGSGYRKDAKATLGELSLMANFSLRGEGASWSGNARSIVSFNFLGPRYGSVAAERDARERAISEVANEIRTQVALMLAGQKPPVAAEVAR